MNAIARILIIDDNAKLMEDALPMYGYEVEVANDGVEGLKILENGTKFDLILLDVVMPNLNGWETLRLIRQNQATSEIPVIILTSVNDVSKQVSGLKIGADDYIVKPFILPNLLARIEALLRRINWNKQNKKSVVIGSLANSLTKREKEILVLVAKGKTNSQIAQELFVTEPTIKTHLNVAFRKLNVTNRTQAVLFAQQSGII